MAHAPYVPYSEPGRSARAISMQVLGTGCKGYQVLLLIMMQRILLRWSSSTTGSSLHGRSFDAVVVGGGHNGLVAVRE